MFAIPKTTSDWIRGIVATAINGFASGVVLIIASPDQFNLQAGRSKLIATSAVFAIFGVANFLKSNPLPPENTSTLTITQTSTQPAVPNKPTVVISTGTGDGQVKP
jgi:hypothetical protein